MDGHQRYEICQKHGIPFKIVEIECQNRDDAKLWIIQNQLARRNLTHYGRCVVALAAGPLLARKAKERQRQGGKSKVSQNSEQAIDVNKELASLAGVSHDTIAKVKVILQKGTEEEKAQLTRAGSLVTINSVYRRIQRDELKTETPPFPAGKFALIYADPPWRFEFTEDERRSVENHYATMKTEELMLLQVSSITQDDCVLAMWAPNCKLDEACRLMNSWGFKYEANIVWIKPSQGLGHHVRNQHELLLIGVKGNPPTPLPKNRPSSIIYAPRGARHSEKPVKAYEILEKMYPKFNKIELFARKHRAGWLAWGNEVS